MGWSTIVSAALQHLPALLVIWLTIYAVYWLLDLAKWPRWAWRDRVLEWCGGAATLASGVAKFRSLALVSAISLFLELLLIRWITAEIRIFAYFKSLVLVACFLGFGLGCYLTRKPIRLAYTLLPLLAMVFLIELPWDPLRHLVVNLSAFIGWFSDVHVWSRAYFVNNFLWGLASASVALSIIIPLFGLIAITFVPLGQLVGWSLENSSKGILAYSVNILASVVGIWLYTLLCFFSTPPAVWFAVLGAGLLVYFWSDPSARRAVVVSCVAVFILFGLGAYRAQWWGEESWKASLPAEHRLTVGEDRTYWSPYQKLTVIPLSKDGRVVRYILNTNDNWYQQMIDLSPAAVARDPDLFGDTQIPYHQYNLPYRFYPRPPKVLIAGAGSGNDVASALRNEAGEVVAVEIDPLIYTLGKELHFERPYSAPNLRFHIDDARSFVQNCNETFDLIVFSILDSHTTSSHYTNIRLDNYVYTVEAMEAMKKLLNPDGLFVMSFSSERPWFAQRLRDVIVKAFGKEPLMLQPNVSFFVVGPGNRAEQALAADGQLKDYVEGHKMPQTTEDAELLTDDWPYLYQQHRGVPFIIWVMSVGLLVISWLTFRRLSESQAGVQWHFFFLGAAFMLLEVQIISKMALLFGTTWLVNSIVITGLLTFILLSNAVVALFPQFPRPVAYVGLFGTMALSYFLPAQSFFYDSVLLRAAVATVVYCSPVFFAGIVFIASFREAGFRADAFGSNLLGSLAGGLLESLSFATGIQALVLVAALLYLVSLLTMRTVRAWA